MHCGDLVDFCDDGGQLALSSGEHTVAFSRSVLETVGEALVPLRHLTGIPAYSLEGEGERERERYRYVYVYIYIYIYLRVGFTSGGLDRPPCPGERERERDIYIYIYIYEWATESSQAVLDAIDDLPPDVRLTGDTQGVMLQLTNGCWQLAVEAAPGTAPTTGRPRTVAVGEQGTADTAPPLSCGLVGTFAPMTPRHWVFLITQAPGSFEHELGSMLLQEGDKLPFEYAEQHRPRAIPEASTSSSPGFPSSKKSRRQGDRLMQEQKPTKSPRPQNRTILTRDTLQLLPNTTQNHERQQALGWTTATTKPAEQTPRHGTSTTTTFPYNIIQHHLLQSSGTADTFPSETKQLPVLPPTTPVPPLTPHSRLLK